jgi:hypothetical protein
LKALGLVLTLDLISEKTVFKPLLSQKCNLYRYVADESGGGRFDWEVEYASRLYLTAFDDARYENVFHAGAGASTDAAA